MVMDERMVEMYLKKWQDILRLRDWDIKYQLVNKEWRKTGDIKIDMNDKKAILLINNYNPKQDNLEGLIIHELLHVKLFGMDQMIEELIYSVFGDDTEDKKFDFAYNQFMKVLEPTVEDLTKGYLQLGGDNKEISFGRVEKQVEDELVGLIKMNKK